MPLLVALYLTAIVAANLLVTTYGPSISILNAFLFIGLDLTTRDALHEAWRGHHLAAKMTALIAAGSILSYVLSRNAGPIALASFVAFAAAATVDSLAYIALHERSYMVKVNGSNVLSAAVDSLIFPALAFGFPLLWPIVLGQFVAKVAGGWIWSVVLPITAGLWRKRGGDVAET
jgi:queuosine precursor transporter